MNPNAELKIITGFFVIQSIALVGMALLGAVILFTQVTGFFTSGIIVIVILLVLAAVYFFLVATALLKLQFSGYKAALSLIALSSFLAVVFRGIDTIAVIFLIVNAFFSILLYKNRKEFTDRKSVMKLVFWKSLKGAANENTL